MSLERFYAGLELRAEGRRLVGPAIRYGEVSPSHRERFDAGAFDLSDGRTRWLDVGHDPERVIAHTDSGGLSLRDTSEALEVSATLPRIPAADRALADVQAGKLRGFSIEFHAETERREGAVRVVSKAVLAGVGLVAHPSYTGSLAEVRAGGARGTIPFNRNLSCECHEGACDVVNIRDVELPKDRDVLAVAGNYAGHRQRQARHVETGKNGRRVASGTDGGSVGDTGRAGTGRDVEGRPAVCAADLYAGSQRRIRSGRRGDLSADGGQGGVNRADRPRHGLAGSGV